MRARARAQMDNIFVHDKDTINGAPRLIMGDFGTMQPMADVWAIDSGGEYKGPTVGNSAFTAPELFNISRTSPKKPGDINPSDFDLTKAEVWAAGLAMFYMVDKEFLDTGVKHSVPKPDGVPILLHSHSAFGSRSIAVLPLKLRAALQYGTSRDSRL